MNIKDCLQKIDAHIRQNHQLHWQKYLRLGSRTVRIICYSQDFIHLIKTQLSYILQDSAQSYDATIVLWNEKEPESFAGKFIDNHAKSRIRLQHLALKSADVEFEIADEKQQQFTRIKSVNGSIKYFAVLDNSYSQHHPLIKINSLSGIINAHDCEQNIYYYGAKDLHPEEFIKQGHIFVHLFNKILKTANSGLVHGAVVGLNQKGILFCGRGQRGKSTLAVLSMMQGFEYVADDYLVLEKNGDELHSFPIYSIITLSPRMNEELRHEMKGEFVSNNARRDKYVIDVKAYHENFREKYPIKICMFPQIVADEKPSIVLCKKGRAITQLVHSTISQMEDKHDIKTIRKLVSFIQNFSFYQINLCSDIRSNVECLRQFLTNYDELQT